MVVHLILPQGSPSNDARYLAELNNSSENSTPADEYYAVSVTQSPKISKTIGFPDSQQGVYVTPQIRQYGQGYVNNAFSIGDLNTSLEYITHNSTTCLEPESLHRPDTNIDVETNFYYAQQKQRQFRKHLTVILSCIYCVFIVTLGVVIYISDIIVERTPIAETFSIYLVVIGFGYVVYLYVDIRLYLNKIKAKEAIKALDAHKTQINDDAGMYEPPEADLAASVSLPPATLRRGFIKPVEHDYCFNTGRHSGSFYLKIGAAGFCLGHLIHSGLLLGYQIVFLTSSTDDFYACASVATLILDIVYPMYSFFQLYFIFKYSNVVINRSTDIARFAMMHCIASSLCFWIWTILRETMDSLTHHSYKAEKEQGLVFAHIPETTFIGMEDDDIPFALPQSSYHRRGARDLLKFLNESSRLSKSCAGYPGLDHIFENVSPYLYPFTVEYSILIVGVLYIIWRNIGNCGEAEVQYGRPLNKDCHMPLLSSQDGFTSNLVIHADCHSSNKGLFAGIIVLVTSLISIILFFIAISDEEFVENGLYINSITELVLLILMTITAIVGYRQITKLDINSHPTSLLDDLLLFLSIPAFFLYAIFSIVPAVRENNIISILNIMLQVIQILVQTPFIIDGLRRCSNSQQLRLEKPGRELITFLVVCNVAMWITETFEVKSNDLRDARFDFYGQVLWTIIGHLTVPLTMFYRFHSSVCLADIWKSAYESANGH